MYQATPDLPLTGGAAPDRRVVTRRLDGLADEPRPGAPRTVADADVERVVTRTLETKPAHATHWCTRGMAKATLPKEPGVSIHLVLDNYATHKTPAVKRWLLRHPEYHLHFIPTGSSWLNQVERFFAEITEKRIRRGVFRSVPALEQAIAANLAEHNIDPKPFAWVADADSILDRIKRLCERTSDSEY